VIDSAPAGFGGAANAGFDGIAETELLLPGGNLEPGERVTMLMSVDVFSVTGGSFENIVQAGASRPVSGDPIDLSQASAPVDIAAAAPLEELLVTKSADRGTVRIGEAISYTVTVTNPSTVRERSDAVIVDRLPPGFVYIPQSAQLDGEAAEPSILGRDLVWAAPTLAPEQTLTLTLVARTSAATVGGETFINRAFVQDTLGEPISNVATATVSQVVEPVFDCGEVIGKVFDDKNRNGYQDEGEPGLPGVRLATVRGLLINTDQYGRYHVTCADIPDADIGSNFLLKLDQRTLPTGYRITTENPRVVRLTRGKITKLNFGATVSRVISLNLTAGAFEGDSLALRPDTERAMDQLIPVLHQEPSVLRLTYHGAGEDWGLVSERLQHVSSMIKDRWRERDGRYRLEIETRATEVKQ